MIYCCTRIDAAAVAPHGGAWIEMEDVQGIEKTKNVAPHGGAWIEMSMTDFRHCQRTGVAPHGGAWIEI